MKFTHKKVWITGASSGIGESLAIQLAQEGAELIISARREERLVELAKRINKIGGIAHPLPLDLTSTEAITEAARKVMQEHGPVDILIHSAGISQRAYAKDTCLAVIRQFMELNFFGVIGLTQACLPAMIKRGSGHIVVISSVVGKMGSQLRSSYSASKHALHGYFDSLRAELHDHGIAVSLVVPGYVQTEISQSALTGDGSLHGKADSDNMKGLPVDKCAYRIIKGIYQKQEEFVVSKPKERLGVLLKRFTPNLLSRILRSMEPVS